MHGQLQVITQAQNAGQLTQGQPDPNLILRWIKMPALHGDHMPLLLKEAEQPLIREEMMVLHTVQLTPGQ